MLKKLIGYLNNISFIKKQYAGIGTIFMLHRVCSSDNTRLLPNENMKVSPDFLDQFITDLKNNGYQFISLDRLYEILKTKEKVKKQVVFTFDDGYLDNYINAYPIFKKHNVPFTIYITTDFIEKQGILWWYELEDLILRNEYVNFNSIRIPCRTKKEKNEAFMFIREHTIRLPQGSLIKNIEKMFGVSGINWHKASQEIMMSWEHITKLNKDNLVTIANHTKTHPVLNKLNESDAKDEIANANSILEQKIEKRVRHFAYPYGGRVEVNEREFSIVRNLSFRTSVTSRHGNIYHRHKDYLEALPRIMLTENFKLDDMYKIRRNRIVVK